ncbi:MAG: FHA domain-containing protein [Gammaproteobacteria bacterium]|nr:FHA domain-containing protein [Gammaproteobacteria bacterium]
MAALILEIVSRHVSQYVPVDKPTLRVGRAFDNDVILTDPAVSPYHFLIHKTPRGGYELRPLADENGIRTGRHRIDDAVALDQLPFEFDAGRTRFRVIDRAQPVAPTRLMSCRNGGACIFGHWSWALALFAVMVLISAFENYLQTHQTLSWESFWQDQLTITATALSLSVGLLLLNRVVSHRWDYPASLSFVSIALIAAFALDQVAQLTNYFFTSELPAFAINLAWLAVLMPLATAWFLIRLNHAGNIAATFVIVALFSPAAYVQVKELASHYDLFDEFSKKTYYSNSLHPRDWRMQATVSIETFLSDSLLMQPPAPAEE